MCLSVNVSISGRLSLCESLNKLVINLKPAQGAPNLSPNDSWSRFQLWDPKVDKWKKIWIDGWMLNAPTHHNVTPIGFGLSTLKPQC